MGLLLNASISQSFLLSSFPESRLACFCRENIDRRWLSRFFFTSVGLEQISMEEKLWSKKKNVSHRHSSILPGNQFGLQTKHCSYIYHLSVILDPQASKITGGDWFQTRLKATFYGMWHKWRAPDKQHVFLFTSTFFARGEFVLYIKIQFSVRIYLMLSVHFVIAYSQHS